MKTGHDGQLLHGQLLCGLLVTMATTALDLSTTAKVLRSSKPSKIWVKRTAVRKVWRWKTRPRYAHTCGLPAQTVSERGGPCGVALPVKCRRVSTGAQRPEGGGGARQVQTDVPERVYCCWHTAARRKVEKKQRCCKDLDSSCVLMCDHLTQWFLTRAD